jgi:hypothetical protein
MNEYKHFKESLGMEGDFVLHTWDEIDRLNKLCDYFIYRGYAVDDECTGYYTVLLYDSTGCCVLDYPIGSKTVLLAPQGIEFMNGNDVITFRASDGTIYSHFLKGGIHQEDLNSIYECVNSKSGLAKCRVDDYYNVLEWGVLDNDENRQND